jgi:hypothetical protein
MKPKIPEYGAQQLMTSEMHWQHKTQTFVAEISELRDFFPTKVIVLTSEKTGNTMTFKYYDTDMDATGEDIYGWRYVAEKAEIELLIIND